MGTSKPSFAANLVAKYSFELLELDLNTTVPVGVLAKKTPADPDDDLYRASIFNHSLKLTSPFAFR